MKPRIIYDRITHITSSTLALAAQRMPLLQTFGPALTSPQVLKFAAPLAVTFVGTHRLSGASPVVAPVGDSVNPAVANEGEEFVWLFRTVGEYAGSYTVAGLPEGLALSYVKGVDLVATISGIPTESGEFSVEIISWRARNGTGTATEEYILDLTVVGSATPYEIWQSGQWEEPELSNESIAGLNADPDKDGFDNLMEFVLDLDPKKISKMPAKFGVDPDDRNVLSYEITLGEEADGVDLAFEECSTLVNDEWKAIEQAMVTRTPEKIMLTIPKTKERMFYRLKASLPAGM